MSTALHSLQYYRQKEAEIYPTIPGVIEILNASEDALPAAEAQYPDALFAIMVASDFMYGNREQNAINQDAYFAIINGENIADVKVKHTRAMNAYLKRHMWDD